MKKLYNKSSGYVVISVASACAVSSSFFADKAIKTSILCYMTVRGVVSVSAIIPLMYLKGKENRIFQVEKKDLLGITGLVEFPLFLEEFFWLKAIDANASLGTAVMNTFPLVNISLENLKKKLYYTPLENSIIIEKNYGVHYKHIIQDFLGTTFYIGSLISLYYDAKESEDNSDESMVAEAIIYGALTSLCTSTYNHFTGYYGKKYDHDDVTYVSNMYGLPIRIGAATIAYLSGKASLEDDFNKNALDLLPAIGLSLVYLSSIYLANYAFSIAEYIGTMAMVMVITANAYSLLLEKDFNSDNFTVYSAVGMLLGVASCFILILNDFNKTKYSKENNKNLVDLIVKNADFAGNIDQVNNNIISEWNFNRDYYKIVFNNQLSQELEIGMDYSETLLVIMSKVLGINFNISEYNSINKLLIINNSRSKSENEKNIDLMLKIPLEKKFVNKKIIIFDDTINIVDFNSSASIQGLSEEQLPILLGSNENYSTFDME
jgi:hypothetical protein